MLAAASIGNETVINVIKPWTLILDLLKQLRNEQDTRTGKGMLGCHPLRCVVRTGCWARWREARMLHQACRGGGQGIVKLRGAVKLPQVGMSCLQNIL